MGIADKMINTNTLDITFVGVRDNTGYTQYAPVGYCVYVIFHLFDTVSIMTVHYAAGDIYTNSRSKSSGWRGWKKATMTTIS